MNLRMIALTAAFVVSGAWVASAQQSHTQHPSGGQTAASAEMLPQERRTAAQAGGQIPMMQGMDMGDMPQNMQDMMAHMTEAQKGYMQAMMRMHGPMMTGMMAKDPDVGFICGMITHHQGAIDMAQVLLKTGNNAEAKKMAEKTIKEQGQEIAQMKEWPKKNTKKEGSQ